MKTHLLFLCILLSLSLSSQKMYEINKKKEALILGGSALMAGSSYVIDSRRSPLLVPAVGTPLPNINSFDKSALNNYSLTAKNVSDIFFVATSLAPFTLLASDKLKENHLEYLVMYTEVAALNAGFTFLVKSATDRKRPYFYNENVTLEERQSLDARKGFFSGHASHTAALSFFTARVFADLYPDSRWKPLVWTGVVLLPATTGYLRFAAGRHFPSDVLVGYGVGAVVGILIPYLHRTKTPRSNSFRISGTMDGLALKVSF